jgi:hypothetical protein
MPQIINLSPIGEVLPGDSLPIFDESNGDTRRVSVDQLETYMQNNLDMPDNSDEVSFLQAGTGAVTRTVQSKLRDVVSVKDFGAVGDNIVDDTAAIQAFIIASRDKRGYIPAGVYRITSALIFDPQYSYNIEGDSWSTNANNATTINNVGTGSAIQIHNSPFTMNYDRQIRIANMTINGNASSLNGVDVIRTPVLLENLWICNHGQHGLSLQDAYSSTFKQVLCVQNYRHGCYIYKQGNALHFDHCVFNGNSRLDGYSGCFIGGTAATENLGLVFTACDFTSNGYPAGVTTAFGIAIQHAWGVSLTACYAESNKSRNVYADNTVRGLSIQNSYWQDGIVEISNPFGLVYENNVHQQVSSTTQANISGNVNDRRMQRVNGNTVAGGATMSFATGVKQINQMHANAIPTSGTFEAGDIVWYASPDYGLPIGWVCTAGGTPGTWRPIAGTIPGAYANWGDSDATLTSIGSLQTNFWQSPLTANRSVTLSTTGAFSGARFRITRTASATGAFNLDVGSGPLKALSAGQWCDVEWDGSAWRLTASGSL